MRDFRSAVNISGFVTRITPLDNGKIVVIANNNDYKDKKTDEWVKVVDFFGVAFFYDIKVEVGDYVIISAELGTRKNAQGETILSLKGLSLIKTPKAREESNEADEGKSAKPSTKSSSAPKSKYVSKRDATEGDEEAPW